MSELHNQPNNTILILLLRFTVYLTDDNLTLLKYPEDARGTPKTRNLRQRLLNKITMQLATIDKGSEVLCDTSTCRNEYPTI